MMQCLLDKLTRLGGINSETLPVVMGGVLQVSRHEEEGERKMLTAQCVACCFMEASPMLQQITASVTQAILLCIAGVHNSGR